MNKKFLLSMFAVAGLMAASCTQDELYTENLGDNQTITFRVGLEGGASTRAMNDGKKANLLIMDVFDEGGNLLPSMRQEISSAFAGGLTQDVDIVLSKGQKYDVVFWAQSSTCDAYTTDALNDIQIDYSKLKSNDDNRDAFYGNAHIEISADGTTGVPNQQEVTLKRPFAQLNFAVSDVEWVNAINAGTEIQQVSVKLGDAYTHFNALTDNASAAVAYDPTFAAADIICDGTASCETLTLDLGDGAKAYHWLSMNYVLVNGKENANVTFTFTTDRGDITIKSDNTPLQRNYRTNLVGRLTTNGSFKVVLDPMPTSEENKNLESGETVTYNVKAGGKYYKTLTDALVAGESDIEISEGEFLLDKSNASKDLKITGTGNPDDVKITLVYADIAWKTATFENITVITSNLQDHPKTGVVTSGECVFDKCKIENVYFCYSGGKTTFNDCEFKITDSNLYNVWSWNADADFNNCVFNSAGKSALVYGDRHGEWRTVNFNDCEFYATTPVDKKAAIEIDSESANAPVNVNIANCTATGFANGGVSGNPLYNLKVGTIGVNCNLSVALAKGVDLLNGVYSISDADGMFWFANEVNVNNNTFSGKTVMLANDIDLNNELWAPVGQTGATQFMGTFDGQDFTISNLKVDITVLTSAHTSAGLFGWLNAATVQNVSVQTASVKGHHNVGTIAGCLETTGCTIINCHAFDVTVSSTYKNADLDGDKAGGIVGSIPNAGTPVKDCTVGGNSAIDATRDAGQVVGSGRADNVINCLVVEGATVSVTKNETAPEGYYDDKTAPYNIREEVLGRNTLEN